MPKDPKRKLTREEKAQIKEVMKRTRQSGKPPATAQQTIPYDSIRPDGICLADSRIYTKTLQFQDINYQLAQNDAKSAIFGGWSDFLNYFDSSIHIQFSFFNLAAGAERFERTIRIPWRREGFEWVCDEYARMLQNQMAKGNNGLVKTKFLTFGIEADSIKIAKPRLERLELDILNNFKRLGVAAEALDGKARLGLMHDIFHMDTREPFCFEWEEYLEDETFRRILEEAEKYIGYPYVWGGDSPETSFDCSGFVSYVFTNSGVRNTGRLGATSLYGACRKISAEEAKPGDIIFFEGTISGEDGITHCGIPSWITASWISPCAGTRTLTSSFWCRR